MSSAARCRWRHALLAVLLFVGCGGCGGGDGDPGGPGGPGVACLQLAPAMAPGSDRVVTTTGPGSTCDTIELDLKISDVTDIFGISFTVSFDPAIVSLASTSSTGSLLESDGVTVEVVVIETNGSASVGLSRFTVTGIDAVGPETLVTLTFTREAGVGATVLSFSETKVLGSETPPQEKPGIIWSGGVLDLV